MVPGPEHNLSGTAFLSIQDKYFSLRNEIDSICLRLEENYREFISCSAACHKCCMDFGIFPIEFYAIYKEISGGKIKLNTNISEGECIFLTDDLCSIYKSRPIICRTQGLPLLFMGEDQWEISYCELNFTGSNITDFNESNTFLQDLYNSNLFLINREFVDSFKDKPYSEMDLIPLKDLSYLMKKK